jgi:hypothetical protein
MNNLRQFGLHIFKTSKLAFDPIYDYLTIQILKNYLIYLSIFEYSSIFKNFPLLFFSLLNSQLKP